MSGGRLNEKCYAAGDRKSREGDPCGRLEAAETAAGTNGGEAAEHGHVAPSSAVEMREQDAHPDRIGCEADTGDHEDIAQLRPNSRVGQKHWIGPQQSREAEGDYGDNSCHGAKIETRSSAASRLQVLLLRVKA